MNIWIHLLAFLVGGVLGIGLALVIECISGARRRRAQVGAAKNYATVRRIAREEIQAADLAALDSMIAAESIHLARQKFDRLPVGLVPTGEVLGGDPAGGSLRGGDVLESGRADGFDVVADAHNSSSSVSAQVRETPDASTRTVEESSGRHVSSGGVSGAPGGGREQSRPQTSNECPPGN